MTAIALPSFYANRPFAAKRFTAIVSWARQHHPFYQQRLMYAEQQVPLLSRAEILAGNEILLNGRPETGRTSGSTGIPVRFAWSAQRQKISQLESQHYVRDWLGGALPRSRIIRVKGKQAEDTLDISAALPEQADFLRQRFDRAGAVSVITYPTNAFQLAQYFLEQGIDGSFVQRFSCFAEAFEPHQEQAVAQAFPNAKVFTTYSATELGMIAARCPHQPDYHHLFAAKLGVEILDDDGQLCPPGQLGRVVITDYFNRITPFIRYDIGDMAAYGDCPCGKISFPALTHIAGKVRGLLRKPNGEKVMFSNLDAALRDLPGVGQFQVIQKTLTHFVLRFVPGPNFNKPLFNDHALRLFQDEFGPTITLEFDSHSAIERGPNGKFYASICEVDEHSHNS